MHEVSFQDKEKEHLTRLQDAEEMKVCMPPLPWSPAHIWTTLSCSRELCLLQRCVRQCGRGRGVGVPMPGSRSRSHGVACVGLRWRWSVQKPHEVRSNSHVALVRVPSPFLVQKGRAEPPSPLQPPVPTWATLLTLTSEEVFALSLNERKHFSS